jgi:sugar phosphate isomerase/epimerase
VRGQIADAGLECVGLHWLLAKTEGFYLTTADAAVRRRTSDYFADLARLCRDLDGSIMVLGSPQQRNLLPGVSVEQAEDFAAEVIRAAVPVFEDCGVTLALEPLGPAEGDFMNTAAAGIRLMEKIDSAKVKLHLDVKAMSSEEATVAEVIRASDPHFVHFHANDPNLLGPGMGEMDFVPIFAALDEVGYDGWVSVEVFDYAPGAEFICRTSMETMTRCAALAAERSP